MKIGTAHRNKIWKSLVEYHQNATFTVDSQSLQRDASNASTISLASQNSISQNSNYCPGYYEVTRYTFKHTISLTNKLQDDLTPMKKQKSWSTCQQRLFDIICVQHWIFVIIKWIVYVFRTKRGQRAVCNYQLLVLRSSSNMATQLTAASNVKSKVRKNWNRKIVCLFLSLFIPCFCK